MCPLRSVVIALALLACGTRDKVDSSETKSAAVAAALPDPAPATGAKPGCGTRPLPDCPLQAWMKGNVASRLNNADTAGLEGAFKRMSAFAPGAGFEEWTAMSTEGARAAHAGDLDGARQACKSCHNRYREAYRASFRARPLPN